MRVSQKKADKKMKTNSEKPIILNIDKNGIMIV